MVVEDRRRRGARMMWCWLRIRTSLFPAWDREGEVRWVVVVARGGWAGVSYQRGGIRLIYNCVGSGLWFLFVVFGGLASGSWVFSILE